MSRIDEIGQNGNDGLHYKVEAVAKKLAGKDWDMMLSGKKGVRRKWVDYIPLAMEVVENWDER